MTSYEKSFKEEAVKLSDETGIKKAAAQLGIPYYTLADWRHRQNIHGDQAHVGSGHKRESGDEKDRRIHELEKENAELARANGILQEALGFFAKNRKRPPVYERGLSGNAGSHEYPAEPQRCGSLLRQRPYGELLRDLKERVAVQDPKLPDAHGGSEG